MSSSQRLRRHEQRSHSRASTYSARTENLIAGVATDDNGAPMGGAESRTAASAEQCGSAPHRGWHCATRSKWLTLMQRRPEHDVSLRFGAEDRKRKCDRTRVELSRGHCLSARLRRRGKPVDKKRAAIHPESSPPLFPAQYSMYVRGGTGSARRHGRRMRHVT